MLDLVAQLASHLGAFVVLQEGVVLLPESSRMDDLPDDLRSRSEVVALSGTAIQAAIDRL